MSFRKKTNPHHLRLCGQQREVWSRDKSCHQISIDWFQQITWVKQWRNTERLCQIMWRFTFTFSCQSYTYKPQREHFTLPWIVCLLRNSSRLYNSQTLARFPITREPILAPAGIGPIGVGTLRIDVTDRRGSGALVNIWTNNKSINVAHSDWPMRHL